MTSNKERHKQLVIRSQDLKNQGKTLFRENPEEYSELLDYNIAVEEQVFLDSPRRIFSSNEEFSR
jgi:hypothetical protein